MQKQRFSEARAPGRAGTQAAPHAPCRPFVRTRRVHVCNASTNGDGPCTPSLGDAILRPGGLPDPRRPGLYMKQLQQFQERWSGDMGGASGSSGLGSGGAATPGTGLGEHSGSFGDPELSRSSLSIWPRGNLTAVVLGGGESDSRRLFPLTQYRTLP